MVTLPYLILRDALDLVWVQKLIFAYTSMPSSTGETQGPHQPRKYNFPRHSFGRKGELRSFKAAWFDNWSWLDYQEVNDSVLCYYCSCASSRNLLAKGLYSKQEETFVTKGFMNWKDACASFWKHKSSNYHIDAVKAITKPWVNVGEMLSQVQGEQKQLNSHMLMTILQNVQFLGWQGLALRGPMMMKAISSNW